MAEDLWLSHSSPYISQVNTFRLTCKQLFACQEVETPALISHRELRGRFCQPHLVRSKFQGSIVPPPLTPLSPVTESAHFIWMRAKAVTLTWCCDYLPQKIFVMPNMDDVYLPIMHSAMDLRSNANLLTVTNDALKDPDPEDSDFSDM